MMRRIMVRVVKVGSVTKIKMMARFTIALLVAIIAQAMAATGPVSTGYYNVFSGYQIKGFGCMAIDPMDPVTVSSWNLGQVINFCIIALK